MAIHAHSTTAPVVQACLLPRRDARGRFVKPATVAGMLKSEHTPELQPEPLLSADEPRGVAGNQPAQSRSVPNSPNHIRAVAEPHRGAGVPKSGDTPTAALHLRRQLAQAAEHGAALLSALGLPRLVGPDFIQVDPVALGDALDVTIAALDAIDGDTDREDGGDDEPSLGWIDGRPQFCGDYQDREHDTADIEEDDPAEDSDPAECDDEHGSDDGEDIGHHASQYAPRPLSPAARAKVAVMGARAAELGVSL